MSSTITLTEAKARLTEIVQELRPGDEIVLIDDDKPVARLVGEPNSVQRTRPAPGFMRGPILYSNDFDAPLEELREYAE